MPLSLTLAAFGHRAPQSEALKRRHSERGRGTATAPLLEVVGDKGTAFTLLCSLSSDGRSKPKDCT